MLDTAFYCVADSRHFVGAAALLNSLRLVGHREPFFLVDAGLSPWQRALIASHATLIEGPADTNPVLLAPVGPLKHPAAVQVILDADMIVTRSLAELVAHARDDILVAFVDEEAHADRFFPEWGSALGLGAVRRAPYLNAGALVVPDSIASWLLPLWNEAQTTVGVAGTRYGGGVMSAPFYFADQDVLNALVAGRLEPAQVEALDHRLAPTPPFQALRLHDRDTLDCRYGDGAQPFLLHHFLAKPWLKATRSSIYSALLSRLLLAPDVTLRLEPHQLPLRLREGVLAAADRRRAHVQAVLSSGVARQLGRFGIRTRLADWRRARARRPMMSRR